MFGLMNTAKNRGGLTDSFQELEDMASSLFGKNTPMSFDLDVKDLGDAYQIEADLPGVAKEDLHVDLEGDYMTISAQRSSQKEEEDKDKNYVRRERSFGSFSRCFDVSNVDTDQIRASYADGVLTLTMPKRDTAQSRIRRLEIE